MTAPHRFCDDRIASRRRTAATLRCSNAGLKSLMEKRRAAVQRFRKPQTQALMTRSSPGTPTGAALIDGEAAGVKLVVRKSDGKRILDHFHDATVTGENEVRALYPASSHPLSMQGTTAGMAAPIRQRLRICANAVNPDPSPKWSMRTASRGRYHGTMVDRSEFGLKRARQNFDDGNERGMHLSFNLDEPNSMAWRAGWFGPEPFDNPRRDVAESVSQKWEEAAVAASVLDRVTSPPGANFGATQKNKNAYHRKPLIVGGCFAAFRPPVLKPDMFHARPRRASGGFHGGANFGDRRKARFRPSGHRNWFLFLFLLQSGWHPVTMPVSVVVCTHNA